MACTWASSKGAQKHGEGIEHAAPERPADVGVMPCRLFDRLLEREPWTRQGVRSQQRPEQRLPLDVFERSPQVELEVGARPRSPPIDDAEVLAVATEAPAGVRGDGVVDRGSPGAFQ